MKYIVAVLLSVLACLTVEARPDTLSLKDCERLAIQNNKQLQSTRLATESSAYALRSAKANYYPNIYAGARGIYSTVDGSFRVPGGNLPVMSPTDGGAVPTGDFACFPGLALDYKVGPVFNGGVTIEQPVYMGGKITAGYRMAKIGTQVDALNERLSEVDIIMDTNRAFAMLVKAGQMLTVAKKYSRLLDELEANVRSAIKNGMRPANDLLKVQVRGNEAQLMVRRAENAIALAQMNLAHIIGIDMFSDVVVRTDLDVSEINHSPEYDPDDITERPEYALLQRQIDYSEQKLKIYQSEMLPQVGLQLGYGYTYGGELNGRTLLHSNTFNAILNISIPITHFGERSNKVKAEKANIERLRLEHDYKDGLMRLELAQAVRKLDEAFLEAELADRSLDQAEENMRMSASQYDNGMETLTDYLEAQLLWQQAYQTKVEARYSLYISHLEYLRASGMLLHRI